jgi:methyl-accepting chemotaxis protein
MKSAEKMRLITQHVERSAQEQAKGGRQITTAIQDISGKVTALNAAHKSHADGTRNLLGSATRIEETVRTQESALRQLTNAVAGMRR